MPSHDRLSRWLVRPLTVTLAGGLAIAGAAVGQNRITDDPFGLVRLECRAVAGGALSDCVVKSEEPEGMGLGVKAIEKALSYRRDPAARPEVKVGDKVAMGVQLNLTKPTWLTHPSPQDMANIYPGRARRMEHNGQAMLSCRVSTSGKLRDCTVESEAPADFDFGQAALKLSNKFTMLPAKLDGRPVDGAPVRVPVRFEMF